MEVKIRSIKNKLLLSKNLFLINLDKQHVRIYNIENRHNYITTTVFLKQIINNNLINLNKNEKVYFVNATEFCIWKDMYSNPDFFNRNKKNKLKINKEEAITMMIKSDFFTNKKSNKNLLSRHDGNINKRIGLEALYRRESISNWWLNQKFNKNNKKKYLKLVTNTFK